MARRLPHLPALDGVRALALLGVLGFHAGFGWLRGGYLPLTAFFVLSGFLITSLLLLEHQETGGIARRAFWVRRARRLAPAAILGVALAALYLWAAGGSDLPRFEGDALSSLLWMTNWRFIASGQSYADLFIDPSPLQHYWSLAIEEQFYLVLPVLAGALLLRGGPGARRRWPFVVVVAGLAVASVVTMQVLHHPGDQPLRTYYGTDTRAAELLIGVLLATALIGPGGLRRLSGAPRRAVEAAGIVGMAGSVWLWCTVTEFDDWLFEGGLAVVALLAAGMVAAASQPDTMVARLLGCRPMAFLGRISYGTYLYHWPLFLWLSPDRTGLSGGPLFVLRMAVTLTLATLSYRFVEQPVREGRLPRPVAPVAWANGAVAAMALVAIAAASLPVSEVTLLAEGVAPPPPPEAVFTDPTITPGAEAPTTLGDTTAPLASSSPSSQQGPVVTSRPGAVRAAPVTATVPSVGSSSPTATAPPATPPAAPAGSAGPAPPPTTAPPAPAGPLRLIVVGDSLAQNLGVGLEWRALDTKDMVVWNRGISGCPIGRGGERWHTGTPHEMCSWWGTAKGRQEIDAFRPSVILVVAGLNDIVDRRRPEWGDYRGPGDPAFDAWLLSEYTAMFDVASKGGVPVVWVPPPCVDWEAGTGWGGFVGEDRDGERRRLHHNSATVPTLRARRSIVVADLQSQICHGNTFDPDALGVENSRPDGLHLTNGASELLANRWLAPLLHDARRSR